MIVVEVYTVERLSVALKDKHFWFQNVAPITKHRAQLVINNPRSQKDDPVLFIAKKGKEIIGYRLVFPDKIYLNGEARRIGWGSSFWVCEQHRGQGVGRLLFEKSFELWGGNIGSLIQSRDAARVYERDTNFFCFSESIGCQFVIRLNTRFWLQKKLRVPAVLGWIFPVIDFPINTFLSALRQGWVARKSPVKNFHLEYCREIADPETIAFVESCNQNSLTRRGVDDLNAIVRYPTSVATPLEDAIGSRYFFSTKASQFEYLYVKIYDSKLQLIGLMLMNIDGGSLKLLYYFFQSEKYLTRIFDIFLLHAARLKTEMIDSFDVALNEYLVEKSGFPTLLKRKRIRRSYLSNHLKVPDPGSYKVYDGDGA